MKQLVIIILVFLISSLSANSQDKIHREEFGLKGNVKSVKENSYKKVEKFGEIVKEKSRRVYFMRDFYYIFNKKGNIINKNEYTTDESDYHKYIFKYNRKGEVTTKKLESTIVISSMKNTVKFHTIYKYDNYGNIIEQVFYKSSNNSFLSKYTYIYNKEGNKIEQNYYDESIDKLDKKRKYKLDDKGNVIEENYYESSGKLKYKYLSKYNEKGNKIEDQTFKPDGSLVYRDIFEYDNYNNITLEEGYKIKYEYDINGNWISKIEFYDNVEGHTIEREIVYF
jgi:hypothetical protein